MCRGVAYIGVLGAEPPVGSRGRVPGQSVRGMKTPEAEKLLSLECPKDSHTIGKFQCFVCQIFGQRQSGGDTMPSSHLSHRSDTGPKGVAHYLEIRVTWFY